MSSGSPPASPARSPTRCSRSRCSAASPTSPPTNFNDWFGWEIPWIAFALFAAVLISVLCYFHVELSVKVLGVALIGEVIILAIFDLVVFGSGGSDADGIQFESLNMFQLTDPGRRPRRRRRPVPRLLVVGRLRGDPELRGGVQEPEEASSRGRR